MARLERQGKVFTASNPPCAALRAARAHHNIDRARTARVQYESRFMWNYFYHTDDVESEARNAAYRARSDEDVWLCLDWLYKGAPVPNEI